MFAHTPNHPDSPARGIRLVLHDRDNTLVTEDVSFYAYQYLLAQAGKQVDIKDIVALGVGGRY